MHESQVSPRKFRNINRSRTKSQGMEAFTIHSSLDNYNGSLIGKNSNYTQSLQQPYSPKKSSTNRLYEQVYNQVYQQFNLQQRARDFILKMKRQKQQHRGKFFKEKEKQEMKRKRKEKMERQYAEQQQEQILQARLEKVTQNIMENRNRVKLRLLAAEKKKNINNNNETLQINLPKLQSTFKMPTDSNEQKETNKLKGSKNRYLIKKCNSEREKNYMSVSLEKSKQKKKIKSKLKIQRKSMKNSEISPQQDAKQIVQVTETKKTQNQGESIQ